MSELQLPVVEQQASTQHPTAAGQPAAAAETPPEQPNNVSNRTDGATATPVRTSIEEQLHQEVIELEQLESLSPEEEQDAVRRARKMLQAVSRKEKTLDDIIADSPFLDLDSPMTPYEWFKMVLLFPWTLFRFVLLVVFIFPVWVVIRLTIVGIDPDEPFGAKRAAFVRFMLRFWSGMLLKLFYHFWAIKVKGREHLEAAQRDRSVLVINHVSYLDPIVMCHLFAPSSVAKAGVANLPFFGTFAVALQTLFVERKGFDVANNQTVRKGGAQLVAERAADQRYPLVMVAPEGTTKPLHCLLRFSTGAFVAGRPVTPVLLNYTRNTRLNPGWGLAAVMWHIWRLIHQFNNHLEVEVCAPYCPSEEEQADARLYAANVRSWMAARLACPQVDHGIAELICLYDSGVDTCWDGKKIVKPDNSHQILAKVGASTPAAPPDKPATDGTTALSPELPVSTPAVARGADGGGSAAAVAPTGDECV